MSWEKVKLGDFLINRENRYKPNDKAISGLKRIDKIDFSGQIYLSNKPSNTDMIIVKNGDLVISGINVEKGAMSVYEGIEDVTATIHYSSYSYNVKKIDIEFLKYFLRSSEFKEAIKEQVPGGIKTEIKPKHLLPLEIIIPTDIKEQKRVILKFQKAETENSNITTQLTHQLSLVSQLRQSFLREAMQGRLLPQNPTDEPASELLNKIRVKKEKLIKLKKLKAGKSSELPLSFVDEYPRINNWSWCKSEDIFFITKLAGFEYTEHIKLKISGEIPVVRAQNVRPLEINKSNLLYISKESSILLDRCSLTKKCLLLTFIGAGIGDVATFNESERWHLAPNVAKAEPFDGCEDLVNVKFVNYFLMSKIGQRELFKHIKATAQPSLSMGTIRDIDIVIPPLPEQHRIVAKLDQLMQTCDALEASIKQSKEQNEMLLQQVLREALQN